MPHKPPAAQLAAFLLHRRVAVTGFQARVVIEDAARRDAGAIARWLEGRFPFVVQQAHDELSFAVAVHVPLYVGRQWRDGLAAPRTVCMAVAGLWRQRLLQAHGRSERD